MKFCMHDGLRYPETVSHCVCGEALTPWQSLYISATDAKFATSCCPNPQCLMLVSLPKTYFCSQCGSPLKPISADVWLEKIVRPALAKDWLAVWQDRSPLVHLLPEMGLSVVEAEKYFDEAFAAYTGATPAVMRRWTEDDVSMLLEAGQNTASMRERVLLRAQELNIFKLCAEMMLALLAPKEDIAPPSIETEKLPPTVTVAPAEEAKPLDKATAKSTVRDDARERSSAGDKRRAGEAGYSKTLMSSNLSRARSFFRNFTRGGAVSKELVYLNEVRKPPSMILGEDAYLLEAKSAQGAFILFADSDNSGWLYPNTRLSYFAEALKGIFPRLTEEQFISHAIEISPVRVQRVRAGRWKVSCEDEEDIASWRKHEGRSVKEPDVLLNRW